MYRLSFSMARSLSILLLFLKNQLLISFLFHWLSLLSLFWILLISAFILIISFLLLSFNLICSSFSYFLRWRPRWLTFYFSSVLNICVQCYKCPFKYCFQFIPQILMFHFHLVKKYCLIFPDISSLSHYLEMYFSISTIL